MHIRGSERCCEQPKCLQISRIHMMTGQAFYKVLPFLQETLRELSSSNQQVLYTCTSARGFAAEVLDAMRRCLFASDGDLNKTASKTNAASSSNVHVIMVVGTPNVGKTSLINALRQHARKEGLLDVPRAGQLPVGALPGVTKHVSGIKVCAAHSQSHGKACYLDKMSYTVSVPTSVTM